MIRHVMPILAVLGYAAGQMAATPHFHDSLSKHDPRPHVHLSGLDGDHHHHHDRSDKHKDLVSAQSDQHGHNDDAVYFQVVVSVTLHAGPTPADLLECSPLDSWLPSATARSSSLEQSLPWHEPRPQSTGEHCALFLTLQTLRI